MTRKDYVLIADAIFAGLRDTNAAGRVALSGVAYRLADKLKQDNASFDRYRFLERALGASS